MFFSSFSRISKTFPLKKNTKVILFVGSGYKRKGLEEFIRIIAALKNQEVIAIVVGKEKNTTYYKNLTLELGINSRVIFAGARTDVDDLEAEQAIAKRFQETYEGGVYGSLLNLTGAGVVRIVKSQMNKVRALKKVRMANEGKADPKQAVDDLKKP